MKTEKTGKRLVHCIATCSVCDWSDGDQFGAARAAAKHADATGHSVTVEQGIHYTVRKVAR